MQSNGYASLRLHVHEAGITGDNFLFTATLNGVTDDTGATLVFAHHGNVAGTLNIGGDDKSVDDFQLDVREQAIADRWDAARNSNVDFALHISTDPFQLTEGLLGGFLLVGVFKPIAALDKSNVKCNWSSEDTVSGAMTKCVNPDDA